jgi:hypothetical protein
LKKELEDLRSENYTLQEKNKKRDSEIDSLKKDLRGKLDAISNLEQQVDSIPALKMRIRELEKSAEQHHQQQQHQQSRPSTSTLKSHNGPIRDPRESDPSYSKTVTIANNLTYEQSKLRKGSQPVIGLQTSEISKYKFVEKGRDKENIDIVKLDASTKFNHRDSQQPQPKFRESLGGDNKSRENIARPESGKSFIRYDDKIEEFAMMQNKMKKANRSDSSRNLSKDKYKESEYDHNGGSSNNEDRFNNTRSYSQKIAADMIEPSKFSTDKVAKPQYKEEVNDRRQSDKVEYRSKTKSDNQLKRNDSKPSANEYDTGDAAYLNKNYIPKPRSGTSGYDSTGNPNDSSKYRKDDSKVKSENFE